MVDESAEELPDIICFSLDARKCTRSRVGMFLVGIVDEDQDC